MERTGGMVAVVQGIRDSGLTVTLLDCGNQYTLMPNERALQPKSSPFHAHPSVNCASQYMIEECSGLDAARNRDNSIQATDGRFASTYKTTHCNVNPTSPPQDVTEFPPQSPEVIHGHGNFVIGGCGSGETGRPAVKTNSYRGGMVWPDKGSVCTSKASTQSDAFANSLRKYPNITPERSSEIVQRLISFTQAKNWSKNHNRCPCSPTRNSIDSESSKHTFVLERNSSKNSIMGKVIYQPELSRNSRVNENSSEREKLKHGLLDNDESWNKHLFYKSNDVRCFKDTARKLRHGFKDFVALQPTIPLNETSTSRIKGQYDYDAHLRRMYEEERQGDNSVNMEIQVASISATTQMESKEILTLPRIVPMQRTLATPLTPISSNIEARIAESLVSTQRLCKTSNDASTCKSIQVILPLDTDLKTISSCFDLCDNQFRKYSTNRSRSKEEIPNKKKNMPREILTLIQEINNNSDITHMLSKVNGSISKGKTFCRNSKHILDNFDILRRSISNNTFFHDDDVKYNVDRQPPIKHLEEKLRPCNINENGNGLVNNTGNSDLQQRLKKQSAIISNSDTFNNTGTPGSTIETVSWTVKCDHETSGKRKYDHVNYMKKAVGKKKSLTKSRGYLSRSYKDYNEDSLNEYSYDYKSMAMKKKEIKNLIDLDIIAFTEKNRINITTESLNSLIGEVFGLFVIHLKNTIPKKQMAEKIKYILRQRGFSKIQSNYLASILIDHCEEAFLTCTTLRLNSSKYRSKALIVLPNITHDVSQHVYSEIDTNNINNCSIPAISAKDPDANVELYISHISNEINEWLTDLAVPQYQDKDLRQSIVKYLAADIIDRHKYLELNFSSDISDTGELEHLKYQIFKVFYKFDITDMTLVDHAHDLMRRVKGIPIPIFSMQGKKGSTLKSEPVQSQQRLHIIETSNLGASSSRKYIKPVNKCCISNTCKRNLNMESIAGKSNSISESETPHKDNINTTKMSSLIKLASTNQDYMDTRKSPQPLPKKSDITDSKSNVQLKKNHGSKSTFSNNTLNGNNYLFSGGIKIRDDGDDENNKINNVEHGFTHNIQNNESVGNEINSDYIQYVKEWIEQIPLPSTSVEDQIVARTTRTDIYNGVLDAVSKLRSDSDAVKNRFLFEDNLDEEIEKIMSNLPQSPELLSKKHMLKVKLIERTANYNDLIKTCLAKSYKEQLEENLKKNLPAPMSSENEDQDILEIYEVLQILNLVEDFIIYSRYQNEDKTVAEAYRNKLLKRTKEFVDELKINHNKALKNIDTNLYIKDILDTLNNVPLPSDKTIQEEADEIFLAIEIDKWFSELPLNQNANYVEQLNIKRLRNHLAKQIIGLEKGARTNTFEFDNSIKHEISKVLGKTPLHHDQTVNINYMVDELVKRLKNCRLALGNENKKVGFNEPDYEEFSRNKPLCSTYTNAPNQNGNTQKSSVLITKTAQATTDPSQLHSGHYHNISKPFFDDLKMDPNCCNTDHALKEIPNYDTFVNTRPRSSSLKDDVESQWYTLQENGQENPELDTMLNSIRNQNKKECHDQSIQTVTSNEQYLRRRNGNIAKAQYNDLTLDSNSRNYKRTGNNTFNVAHPNTSLFRGNKKPHWYSLQENKPEYSQFPYETSHFIPHPLYTQHRLEGQGRCNKEEQHNTHENYVKEFVVPQRYLESDTNGDKEQRTDISHQSQRNSSKRTSLIHNDDAESQNNNHMIYQRWASSDLSKVGSPTSQRFSIGLEQVPKPRRASYHPEFSKEPNRYNSNHSPEIQNIIDEPHSSRPQMSHSNVYYKSTDKVGRKQTIEHNKSTKSSLHNIGPHECPSGYYQPSVLIPPPAFIPLWPGNKKGAHLLDRNMDGRYLEEEEEEEESEAENYEEQEIRCRCVEKTWKNTPKYRYYPVDQHDGYPIYLTSPYFYPYYY